MLNLPHWPKVPIYGQPKKPDLKAARTLLNALDNPHKKLPPTIHIAGTNGKGSTAAMLKSIFEAAGYKVHTYTSPHLIEFNERINLAGQNISDHHLFELLETVRTAAEPLGIEPSFFEGITIAAFLAFSQTPADLLILETGMGGRLDCTNVTPNPLLTIITPISFDHMGSLGNSLVEIATEKAGIIKPGVPCVISAQNEEVYELLLAKCEQSGSPAFCYEYDYIIEEINNELVYRSQKYTLALPRPSLLGKHQYINASAVVAAVMLINGKKRQPQGAEGLNRHPELQNRHPELDSGSQETRVIPDEILNQVQDDVPRLQDNVLALSDDNGFKISNEDIAYGLQNAKWPGRIEKLAYKKYPNLNIYLDGAHNEAGAKALAYWAEENFKEPVYLIVGMTKNRNVESFCQHFQNIALEGRAVKVLSEPSSYHPDVITSAAKAYVPFKSSESLEEALGDLNNLTATNIIITGSLFLVSDFYKLL